MRIARSDADFNRELTQETQRRFEVGTASRSDVLNFRIRTYQAEDNVLASELRYRNAKAALAELLGLRGAALPDNVRLEGPREEQLTAAVPSAEEALQFALTHRPDIRRVARALDQLQAQLSAEKGSYWPSVSLQASYGETRQDNMRFNDDRDGLAFAGAVLSWDLFTGGSTYYACRRLEAQIDAQRQELIRVKIEVAAELRQQVDTVVIAMRQVELQDSIYEMTKEARDLVRDEYSAGKTSLTRLNEAQTDLTRASGRLAAARIRLLEARENAAAASGRNLAGLEVQRGK
jgi:outer membrane protein TolC